MFNYVMYLIQITDYLIICLFDYLII